MRKTSLILLFSLLVLSADAQLFKTYNPGYYVDKDGNKITGVLSFNVCDNKFLYKPDAGGSSQKIKIEDVRAVVTALPSDSLTVMTEDGKDNKRYFAHLLIATTNTNFYYKYQFMHWGPGPTMSTTTTPILGATGSSPRFRNNMIFTSPVPYQQTKQILMYQDGNTTFELTKSNFVVVLSKAFADMPELAHRIQSKEFPFKKLDEIFDLYIKKTRGW
jgi:hypothetical protein